jgi:hypothetical protein
MEHDELTIEDVKEMSPDQVNVNWRAVQAAMAAGRHREVDDGDGEETAEPLGSTPSTWNGTSFDTLTWDRLRAMSEAEHVMHKDAVDRFLSQQGRAR